MPLLGIHAAKEEVDDLFNQLDHDGDGIIAFKEFNRVMRRAENEGVKRDASDPFGKTVSGDGWRPKSPPIHVVDVGKLMDNVRTEQRLRGLYQTSLKLPGMQSPSSLSPTIGSPLSVRPPLSPTQARVSAIVGDRSKRGSPTPKA